MSVKLITYDNLASYDTLLKQYVATEDAKSIKSISYDSSTRVVSFFKTDDGSGTAAYTVTLPDTSNFINKVSNATAGDFVTVTATGELVDAGDSIDADKIDYDNTTSGLTATEVQSALDELASQSAGGVASKTIWVEDASAGQSDYAKVYKIYQCATQAEEAAGTLKGTINIPKDLFIKSASVETVETADVPYEGAAVGDKYIDIEVQNQAAHLYVPCNSLVDEYTAQQSASQIQLAIDANNVISATVVAGSIGATELASNAVTTAKITDGNVTKAKLAQAVQDSLDLADSAIQTSDMVASNIIYEEGTGGADNVTVADAIDDIYDQLGTGGSVDDKITAAIEALDADLDASGTAAHGGTFVVSGVTEVDGVLTAVDSVEVEAAGAAAAAIASLDSSTSDAGVSGTSGSTMNAITGFTFTDGKVTAYDYTTFGSAALQADTYFMKTSDYTSATSEDIADLFDDGEEGE